MSRPSLDSHPFTSSGHSNAHATPCSAHAPAAPSPAAKPWNGKATDHGAVAPCSAWCATRWRPGQHRTGCCRLALMEKRNGAHGELKASDIPYKVKRATKDEKTVTSTTCYNIHTSKFLYGLPTAFAHSPPKPSFFSILIPYMYFFGGDLLTSCPSKSISKNKIHRCQDAATQEVAEGDQFASTARCSHRALRESLRPTPCGFLLVLLGVMVRGPETSSKEIQKD